MPLIPVPEKLDWQKPPVMTICLIILNIFVFIFFQSNENFYYQNAENLYFRSGLADLELKLYSEYIEITEKREIVFLDSEDSKKKFQFLVDLHGKSERDKRFFTYLHSGDIVDKESEDFLKWKDLRREYEKEKSEVISFSYGLVPGNIKPLAVFSYMFLHGSLSHLIGNMIFLWLVGVMIEYSCSRKIFVLIYLSTGIFSGLFFSLFNLNSLLPLVGASGAISGFMGAYTVIFMKKRVKVFLYLGFYFNYFRLPAIVLLPIWLIKEIYPFLAGHDSFIAYEAHLGGLICGSLEVLINRRKFFSDEVVDDKELKRKEIVELTQQGVGFMKELDFNRARYKFREAAVLDPESSDLKKSIFNAEKNFPTEKGFHLSARDLIFHLFASGEPEEAHEYFEKYKKITTPKLTAEDYLRISEYFISWERFEAGEKLMELLVKKRPELPGLSSLIFRYASLCSKRGDVYKSQRYFGIIRKYFKGTPEYESLALKEQN